MKHLPVNIKQTLKACLLMAALMSALISCKKNEEPPIPVGKPVPYSGQMLVGIDAALAKSPYKLFVAAWQRAGMDSLIQVAQPGPLTIFAPTDSAFTAAGYSLTTINSTSKANLDTLLAFHVVQGIYADSLLNTLLGTTAAQTLLTNPNPPAYKGSYTGYSSTAPLIYFLHISANNGFWINGKNVKTQNKNMAAYRALIYPVNQVLQRPTKDISTILHTDPRFSYLMQAYRLNDSVYATNYYNYHSEDTAQFALSQGRPGATLFATTDDAFKNFLAGIYNKSASAITFHDLQHYQNRDNGNVTNNGTLSSLDSIITSYYVPSSRYAGGYFATQPYVAGRNWFYNDLLFNPAALSGYVLVPVGYYGQPAIIVDLKFLTNGNTVTVKRDTSNVSPAINIIQRDIVATNGVIQVVDGLLKN